MPVRVITDSCSYIPEDLRTELGIVVVSLSIVFPEGPQREVDVDDAVFYKRLVADNKLPTSSQPTPAEMEDAFRAALEEGLDVVGVFISSDMSGTFSSAEMAKRTLLAERPGAIIELVDARSNSMQVGMAALSAARAGRDGADAATCAAAARETMRRTRFLFTPHTLDYLRMGGRIGAASALLGTLLQIRPILTVENGVTAPFDKVRTKKRAVERMLETFVADVEQYGLRDVIVHHIDDPAEGAAFAAMVEPIAGHPVRVISIGAVVGLHVGPATVAIIWETEKPLRDAV